MSDFEKRFARQIASAEQAYVADVNDDNRRADWGDTDPWEAQRTQPLNKKDSTRGWQKNLRRDS